MALRKPWFKKTAAILATGFSLLAFSLFPANADEALKAKTGVVSDAVSIHFKNLTKQSNSKPVTGEETPYLTPRPTINKVSPKAPFQQGPASISTVDRNGGKPRAKPTPAAYTKSSSFQGTGFTGWIPPDPHLAVGTNYVGTIVNSSVEFFTKAGVSLGRQTLSTFFSSVKQSNRQFDPKILYDHFNNRWITISLDGQSPTSSGFLVAASKTGDPTGAWWQHRIDMAQFGEATWADYPGAGFDSSVLYLTANMFTEAGAFTDCKILILDLAKLEAGTFSTFGHFADATSFSIKPAIAFGAPGEGYLVATTSYFGTLLKSWKITNPLTSPTMVALPNISVGSYFTPPDAAQLGGSILISTNDSRVLNAVYRNGSVVTTFTTGMDWGSGSVSAIRIVKYDPLTGVASIDETYGSDGVHYFFPAVTMDGSGNIHLVFNRSSASEYVSIRFTARGATDTALQSSALLKAGEAYYVNLDTKSRNRWGDYNGIAVDPSDTDKVWFFSEYPATATTWSTWIGATKFTALPTIAIPILNTREAILLAALLLFCGLFFQWKATVR